MMPQLTAGVDTQVNGQHVEIFIIAPTDEQARARNMSAAHVAAWRRAEKLCIETAQENMTRADQEDFQRSIYRTLFDHRDDGDRSAPGGPLLL